MYSSDGVYRRLPENILPKADEYFGVPRYKTQKEKEEGVFFIDQCAGWIHPQTTG
jgi:hypothetical protein